ncbi:periplasmic heavy metal sensor [Henriciella sp. AS95]|uniref:periplasmic heavy metal sensor n=1 Tax=Henriciella sp. AS95 TaxID=3135782 RepID=UPI0031725552
MKKFSPLTIALIVSLVANALLIGLVAGSILGKPDKRHRGPGRANPDFMIARGIQSVVPDSERKQIRQAFRQAFADSRALIDEKREAQRRLREAMLQTPFDQEAVEQAFADIRAADIVLNERFQASLTEALADLDESEREALGAWLEDMDERFDRRRTRRGERDGQREPPPPARD